MKIHEMVEVTSVSGFTRGIGAIANSNVIFRGHADIAWDLKPKLYRAEYGGLKKGEELKEYELKVLRSFMQRAYNYISDSNINAYVDYLKLLYIAQHHGVPTRLLDFTTNPLIALYFACYGEEKKDKDGAVFITFRGSYKTEQGINEKVNDYFTSPSYNHTTFPTDKPVCPDSIFLIPRMTSQASAFLVWGNDKSSLCDIGSDILLSRMMINRAYKQRILDELELLDIHKATVYSSLDKLGEYIDEKYKKRSKDEPSDKELTIDKSSDKELITV
jgi:hypothetical protein